MSLPEFLAPDDAGCVLYIKHMVCARGIRVVRWELENLGLRVFDVRLGAATVAGSAEELDWARIRAGLAAAGFALLEKPQHTLVRQIKRVVDELLHRPETLRHRDFIPTLAQEVGLSMRQLLSLFARLPVPESLLSYIKHQRLVYAQELLGTSPLGIGRIARQLGYNSLAHFSGQFRRFAQCAPSAYRQQLRSTTEAAARTMEVPNSASRRANNIELGGPAPSIAKGNHQPPTSFPMHTQNQSLLDALNACIAACEHCISACLQEDDVKMMAQCISIDRDCADICALTARFVARGSKHAPHLLKECAEICKACGDECAKHTHMQHCQECAEACRRCEQACRQGMAA